MARSKTILCEYAEHPEWGGFGLVPCGSIGFDPLGPMGVVHDLVEHDDVDLGSIHNELRAFGRMAYIRGEGGYWEMKGQRVLGFPSNAAGEILQIFAEMFWEAKPHTYEPPPGDVDIEPVALEAATLAVELADREFGDPELTEWFAEYHDEIAVWLTIGYRAAAEEYGGWHPHDICQAWLGLEKLIADALKGDDHPWGEAFVGDQIEITWHSPRCAYELDWKVEPITPEDDDEEDD